MTKFSNPTGTVTRQKYIDQINLMRSTATSLRPEVSTTDIARASARGVSVAITNNIAGLSNTGVLIDVDGDVRINGSAIIANMAQKAKEWAKVRYIQFTRLGDGATHYRYGNITSPTLPERTPSRFSNFFYLLTKNRDISGDRFIYLIDILNQYIYMTAISWYPTVIYYCHSSCHNNCHNSRGRR